MPLQRGFWFSFLQKQLGLRATTWFTSVSPGQRAGTGVVSVGRYLQRQTCLQGKFSSCVSLDCI